MIWLLEHAEEEEIVVPNKPVLINKALKDPEPEKIETLEDPKVTKPLIWFLSSVVKDTKYLFSLSLNSKSIMLKYT